MSPLKPASVSFLLACMLLLGPKALAQEDKMWDLAVDSERVEQAVAPQSLRAAAAKTDDPDVLLGLAFLARVGEAARAEIGGRAAELKPEHAPVVAVLAVMMDGVDETSVAALLERDPENALGHYLRAYLLHRGSREAEALEAFRRAAELRELRLYDDVTTSALLKALDTLGLEGRDRLCALSWIGTRKLNFGAQYLQRLHGILSELSQSGAPNEQREEISDMLLILAGHLARTNFNNRLYARWALETSFRLKAEAAAAQESPRTFGYAAVTQALVSTSLNWPEINGEPDVREVAQFLPSRILWAFARLSPREPELFDVKKRDLLEEDRPAFEQARQATNEAAARLIEAAMAAPEDIVGAYLRGVPQRQGGTPWVSQWTQVERVMEEHPEVFRAAVAYEQATFALEQAGRKAPLDRNIGNMMRLGWSALAYAQQHDGQFPPSLEALAEQGLLEEGVQTRSLITGRPYLYVASGEHKPEKQHEAENFIIFYDDNEIEGRLQCFTAIGMGAQLPAETVKEQLRQRGK